MSRKTLGMFLGVVIVAPVGAFLFWHFTSLIRYAGVLRSNEGLRAGYVLGLAYFAAAACLALFPHKFNSEVRPRGVQLKEKVAILLGAALFAWLSTSIGFPLLLSGLADQPVVIATSVDEIDLHPSRRSRCDAELNVAFDTGIFSFICVTKSFGAALDKGQPVRVSGRWVHDLWFLVEAVEAGGSDSQPL